MPVKSFDWARLFAVAPPSAPATIREEVEEAEVSTSEEGDGLG